MWQVQDRGYHEMDVVWEGLSALLLPMSSSWHFSWSSFRGGERRRMIRRDWDEVEEPAHRREAIRGDCSPPKWQQQLPVCQGVWILVRFYMGPTRPQGLRRPWSVPGSMRGGQDALPKNARQGVRGLRGGGPCCSGAVHIRLLAGRGLLTQSVQGDQQNGRRAGLCFSY